MSSINQQNSYKGRYGKAYLKGRLSYQCDSRFTMFTVYALAGFKEALVVQVYKPHLLHIQISKG